MRFRLAALGAALVACVTVPIHPRAREMHDRGIAYLNLALDSANDVDRRRLCEQAEQCCRHALEYDDRFAHGYDCLGAIEVHCHRRYEEAADFFKAALSRDSDFAEAHSNLGATFERRGDYESASEEYAAALEIDPGYADARENLAIALIHLGRHEKARAHLIRLAETTGRAEAYHQLGYLALVTEQFGDAEFHLKRCLELEPEHPVCSYELGNVYLATERPGEAILAYANAVRYPSAIEIAARQNMRVAYQRLAHRDGAILALIDRCRLEPGNATCHFDLGVIWAERGLFEEAVREWRATAELAPDYCTAHFRLAMEASRVLDTPETEARCRATIECARRTEDRRYSPIADECREVIQRLTAPEG